MGAGLVWRWKRAEEARHAQECYLAVAVVAGHAIEAGETSSKPDGGARCDRTEEHQLEQEWYVSAR